MKPYPAEVRAEVARLRATGLGYKRIAAATGVPMMTVRRWVNPSLAERERANARSRKTRYRGTCVDCGASTSYSGHGSRGSDRCSSCALRFYPARFAAARRGHGPVVDKALAFLSEPRRFREIRDHLGITDGHTGQMLDRLHHRYGLVRRLARGVYVRADVLDEREAA